MPAASIARLGQQLYYCRILQLRGTIILPRIDKDVILHLEKITIYEKDT